MNDRPRSLSTRSFVRMLRRASTPAEQILWEALRSRRLAGLRFRRQHPVAGFVVDFYCPDAMLAIEVDGAVHHGADAQARDAARTEILGEHGIRVLRFSNDDVERDLPRVLEAIVRTI